MLANCSSERSIVPFLQILKNKRLDDTFPNAEIGLSLTMFLVLMVANYSGAIIF